MSTGAAAAELEQVTRRAIDQAARCGHLPGPCVFCSVHAQAILDAAEAYAATVAARMLDNFREGLPARRRTGSLAERIADAGPRPGRISKRTAQP